jgi:hypothetical protein
LPPRAHTGTAAWRVMRLAAARPSPNAPRVLNRAMSPTRPAGHRPGGRLSTWPLPAAATIVLGANNMLAHRSARQRKAKDSYHDAPRPSKPPLIRCFGLKWVALMPVAPVPWSQRVWASPCLTTRRWPKKPHGPRRLPTRGGVEPTDDTAGPPLAAPTPAAVDRRWRLRRGVAASRVRETARDHEVARAPGCGLVSPAQPPPRGKHGPNPLQGPAPLAGLGGARRDPQGDRGRHPVRPTRAKPRRAFLTQPCGTPRSCPPSTSATC